MHFAKEAWPLVPEFLVVVIVMVMVFVLRVFSTGAPVESGIK